MLDTFVRRQAVLCGLFAAAFLFSHLTRAHASDPAPAPPAAASVAEGPSADAGAGSSKSSKSTAKKKAEKGEKPSSKKTTGKRGTKASDAEVLSAEPTPEETAAAAKTGLTGTLNLNTATAAELMLLPGIGKKTAARIVEYRAKHPFKQVPELARVHGIGLKTVRKLKPWIAVTGETTLAKPAKARKSKRAASAGGAVAPVPTVE